MHPTIFPDLLKSDNPPKDFSFDICYWKAKQLDYQFIRPFLFPPRQYGESIGTLFKK